MSNLPHIAWEYRDLTVQLRGIGKSWITLADYESQPEILARRFFWEVCEAEIRAELQRWENDGWELAEPASLNRLRLDCAEYIERGIGLIDVMLWITTLGVALLINILLSHTQRRYVIYKPSEFSIVMRRPQDLSGIRTDIQPLHSDEEDGYLAG